MSVSSGRKMSFHPHPALPPLRGREQFPLPHREGVGGWVEVAQIAELHPTPRLLHEEKQPLKEREVTFFHPGARKWRPPSSPSSLYSKFHTKMSKNTSFLKARSGIRSHFSERKIGTDPLSPYAFFFCPKRARAPRPAPTRSMLAGSGTAWAFRFVISTNESA